MVGQDKFKTYLGDGAYVAVGCYESEVVLTTEDGQSAQNTVVLGPTEVAVLQRWFTHRTLRWEAEHNERLLAKREEEGE